MQKEATAAFIACASYLHAPTLTTRLHLRLDLLQQLRQLALIRARRGPSNAQALLLIRLWNQVKMYMVDLLVRNPAVVL
jgi:hypothetical protein